MNNNKENTTKKETKNERLAINDDQLGENASEVYRSENYDNSLKSKEKNKDIK